MVVSPIARVTDQYQGIFIPPSPNPPVFVVGSFVSGAIKTYVNQLGAIRIGDLGQSNNPYAPINTAFTAGAHMIEGKLIHRLGDKVDIGLGQLGDTITGSPNTQCK